MSEPVTPVTPVTPAARAGVRTSEFALNLLAIFLSALFLSDAIPTSGPIAKVAAVAALVLTSLGYTVSRTVVKRTGALVLVLLFASPHMMACGGTGALRAKAVNVSLVSADTLNAAFVAFDEVQQSLIVAKATSMADGERALLDWRSRQAQVRVLFDNLYRAITMAKLVNDDASAASVVKAMKLVKNALAKLGVKS
jgi:hypothetical protein